MRGVGVPATATRLLRLLLCVAVTACIAGLVVPGTVHVASATTSSSKQAPAVVRNSKGGRSLEITGYIVEVSQAAGRSAVLAPPATTGPPGGFPESTRFGKLVAFDVPLLVAPGRRNGTDGDSIANYRGSILYASVTESHALVTATLVFNGAHRALPAGSRLLVQGSFETASSDAPYTLLVLGGTGPFLGATGRVELTVVEFTRATRLPILQFKALVELPRHHGKA